MNAEVRILDAALKVFASEGFTGATTRRIADEANVAEVTIFRKFQSKENLLKEVMIKNRPDISELDFLFSLENNNDITADLSILGRKIAKDLIDKKKDSKNRMFMFMLFEEGRRRPEVARMLTSVFAMYLSRLSQYFDLQIQNGKLRDINSHSAALFFMGYFVHTSLVRGVVDDAFVGNIEQEVERFTDIFTHGILNTGNKQTGDNCGSDH